MNESDEIVQVSNPTSEAPLSVNQSPAKISKHMIIGICVGLLLSILILLPVYMLFLREPSSGNINKNENTVAVEKSPTITHKQQLERYSNPDIQGMTFEYDPTVWEITELTREKNIIVKEHNYGGVGVLLRQKSSEGSLLISYNLAYGVGGGRTLLRDGDLVRVKGNLSRVSTYNREKDITSYSYGFDTEDTHTIFSKSSDVLKSYIDGCNDPEAMQGYGALSDIECRDLKSGKIIGVLPQPTFTRSIKLKRIAPLGEIDSTWANDPYINETGIDDGSVIIEPTYIGNSPEEADKIVTQFTSF